MSGGFGTETVIPFVAGVILANAHSLSMAVLREDGASLALMKATAICVTLVGDFAITVLLLWLVVRRASG